MAVWPVAFVLALLAASASAAPCRMQDGAQHEWCGLPYELSNFQVQLRHDRGIVFGLKPVHVQEVDANTRFCLQSLVLVFCSLLHAVRVGRVTCSARWPLAAAWLPCAVPPVHEAPAHCLIPHAHLQNHTQGHHKCNSSVILGRPRTYSELSQLVKAYPKVGGRTCILREARHGTNETMMCPMQDGRHGWDTRRGQLWTWIQPSRAPSLFGAAPDSAHTGSNSAVHTLVHTQT